jgi:hypothetical protein
MVVRYFATMDNNVGSAKTVAYFDNMRKSKLANMWPKDKLDALRVELAK